MKTFTLDCHPGTLWKCRVVVHPTLKAMRAERHKFSPYGYSLCSAFCRQNGDDDTLDSGHIAEMHFYRGGLQNATIVHECAHAAVHYAKWIKLDLHTRHGDEHFAESLEHLVEGTLHGLKMDGRRKPTT